MCELGGPLGNTHHGTSFLYLIKKGLMLAPRKKKIKWDIPKMHCSSHSFYHFEGFGDICSRISTKIFFSLQSLINSAVYSAKKCCGGSHVLDSTSNPTHLVKNSCFPFHTLWSRIFSMIHWSGSPDASWMVLWWKYRGIGAPTRGSDLYNFKKLQCA